MLKIGSFTQEIPAHTQLKVEGQSEFVILELDSDGKPKGMVARSNQREIKFTVRKQAKLRFETAAKQFISVDARPVMSDSEKVSDIPYEVPDDNQASLTLEEKLKLYLAEMVKERYGEDSDAFDTFEDAMDFEEDDDESLSGFEVSEIVEEVPEPVQPEPAAEAPENPETTPPPEETTPAN